jgi:uncharacterized membrane protein (UPF0127 family)
MPAARRDWTQRLARLPARELPGGLVLHVATTMRARGRGLAGLDDLGAGHALHLPRTRAVHTFGMRFALDLVWLGRDWDVLRVDAAVPRRRHRTCLRAAGVVECRAGEGPAFAAALRA